jgi:hypothetical protein
MFMAALLTTSAALPTALIEPPPTLCVPDWELNPMPFEVVTARELKVVEPELTISAPVPAVEFLLMVVAPKLAVKLLAELRWMPMPPEFWMLVLPATVSAPDEMPSSRSPSLVPVLAAAMSLKPALSAPVANRRARPLPLSVTKLVVSVPKFVPVMSVPEVLPTVSPRIVLF